MAWLGVRLLHGTELTKLWAASWRVWKRPFMVDWTFKFLKPPEISATNLVIVDTLVHVFAYIGEVKQDLFER